MTKFSSFKKQQKLFESWRRYTNESFRPYDAGYQTTPEERRAANRKLQLAAEEYANKMRIARDDEVEGSEQWKKYNRSYLRHQANADLDSPRGVHELTEEEVTERVHYETYGTHLEDGDVDETTIGGPTYDSGGYPSEPAPVISNLRDYEEEEAHDENDAISMGGMVGGAVTGPEGEELDEVKAPKFSSDKVQQKLFESWRDYANKDRGEKVGAALGSVAGSRLGAVGSTAGSWAGKKLGGTIGDKLKPAEEVEEGFFSKKKKPEDTTDYTDMAKEWMLRAKKELDDYRRANPDYDPATHYDAFEEAMKNHLSENPQDPKKLSGYKENTNEKT